MYQKTIMNSSASAAGSNIRTRNQRTMFSPVKLAKACLVVAVCLATLSCSQRTEPNPSAANESSDSKQNKPEDDAPMDVEQPPPKPKAPDSPTDSAGSGTEKGSPTAPRSQQSKPSRKPSPTAICGHSVAYAGWSPQGDGAGPSFFVRSR